MQLKHNYSVLYGVKSVILAANTLWQQGLTGN